MTAKTDDRLVLSKEVVNLILLDYNLGPADSINLIDGGALNTSYSVMTKHGKYILTICSNSSYSSVKKLALLLNELKARDFRTTVPVVTKDGQFVGEFENTPILIKEFIEGSPLESTGYNQNRLYEIGRQISLFHNLDLEIGREKSIHLNHKNFENLISNLPMGQFRNIFDRSYAALLKEFPPDLPIGLVHADIFADNIIVDSKGQPVIIDFECVGYFPLVFDLSMAMVGIVFSHSNSVIDYSHANSLLEGYLSKRVLSQNEMSNIQFFCKYGALGLALWRYNQYEVVFKDSRRIKPFHQMLDIYNNLNNMGSEVFLKQILGVD